MMRIEIRDLGLLDYDEAWRIQHELFDAMVEAKRHNKLIEREWILIVEHPPVVTLGKHARETNLLVSRDEMERKGIKCRHIERGGDVTFHVPGQLVCYPIIDLSAHGLGVKDYVNLLEEAVIRTLSRFGVSADRVEGASGVWLGKGSERERKICALGVKCSRFCTMHGLALNVNNDLGWFGMINPCGFVDKGVTSLKVETGREIDMEEVKGLLSDELVSLLNAHYPLHIPAQGTA